ncbi:unnamed protein product, partial [Heterosigma akashiwo]
PALWCSARRALSDRKRNALALSSSPLPPRPGRASHRFGLWDSSLAWSLAWPYFSKVWSMTSRTFSKLAYFCGTSSSATLERLGGASTTSTPARSSSCFTRS